MSVALPDSFRRETVQVGDVRINTLVGGDGPPALLLHGYPQTHLMWHQVAPALAEQHTVVLTDLRGYGDSDKPAGGPGHQGYSKRTMARDQVLVMRELGTKYPLADDKVVEGLGYSPTSAVQIPDELLDLLPAGPVLTSSGAVQVQTPQPNEQP